MKQIDTPFIAFDFTDEERLRASVLSEEQRAYLQTELAIRATQRVKLSLNPANLIESMGELEYLRGTIEQLQLLINTSDANREKLADLTKQLANRQNQS